MVKPTSLKFGFTDEEYRREIEIERLSDLGVLELVDKEDDEENEDE